MPSCAGADGADIAPDRSDDDEIVVGIYHLRFFLNARS